MRQSGKKAYCTYCSKKKRKAPTLLPAIKLYDSDRIRKIYRRARNAKVEFLILSGEYGLLSPSDEIPYYDHLLSQEEVGGLIEKVTVQLKRLDINGITYFTGPWPASVAVRPYLDTIAAACGRLGVSFTLEILSETK